MRETYKEKVTHYTIEDEEAVQKMQNLKERVLKVKDKVGMLKYYTQTFETHLKNKSRKNILNSPFRVLNVCC
jgi:hypothetical protein